MPPYFIIPSSKFAIKIIENLKTFYHVNIIRNELLDSNYILNAAVIFYFRAKVIIT